MNQRLVNAVEQAITENPQAVKDYHDGKGGCHKLPCRAGYAHNPWKAEPERTVELIKERI